MGAHRNTQISQQHSKLSKRVTHHTMHRIMILLVGLVCVFPAQAATHTHTTLQRSTQLNSADQLLRHALGRRRLTPNWVFNKMYFPMPKHDPPGDNRHRHDRKHKQMQKGTENERWKFFKFYFNHYSSTGNEVNFIKGPYDSVRKIGNLKKEKRQKTCDHTPDFKKYSDLTGWSKVARFFLFFGVTLVYPIYFIFWGFWRFVAGLHGCVKQPGSCG